MIEIIPAILTDSAEKFEAMVRRLEPHVQRVHLDIVDGKFADNKTISGWKELLEIKTPLAFDVHLMVTNPTKQMEHWYKTSADRFIIH
ncbi:MAG: ribulose-phosphate 3-epimerase, partial [Candidatus Yanofskybacteria bacterium]|nr:ribulose-phosphate 3-epimerase [Candidatus Yanofskybacteria bacterium]